MKIVSIIIMMLLLSGIITLYNEFGLMGGKVYNPNYNVSETSVSEIKELYTVETKSDSNILTSAYNKLSGLGAIVGFVLSSIWMTLTFGNLISEYIPGEVGAAFGLIVNSIILFLVGWSIVQIYLKINPKSMD